MLLVDATTGEHARGIGTVIRGVVGGLEDGAPAATIVAAGPALYVPARLRVRRVAIARTRPGRLLYQRMLLPYDAARLEVDDERIDRVLLLDAYVPLLKGRQPIRYGALIHDTLPLSHPEFWPTAKRFVKLSAFWSLRRNASVLFTSTEFNAREIRRLTGRGSRVIRFGCGQITDEEADAALSSPLAERRPYLLYVGALEPRKGLLTLVDAFERLIATGEGDGLRLIFAGGGRADYLEALRKRIGCVRRGLIDLVEDPGRSEVLRLVAEAGALTLPSRAEGFGLPIIEALALGTPVVASNLEGIREWAGNAIRYAPCDQPAGWVEPVLAALNADEDERRKGQSFARAFRWRACADQLTNF